MQSGRQLHTLFVTILCNCTPSEPRVLWERFKENICDDLKHALHTSGRMQDPTDAQAYDYGLY
ncbi:hypothetical protein PAXINDRAFT_58044, partial [Paxillus involutus ATCC 200175]